MRYYVYILKCADNSYYTGITNNLERRVEEHKSAMDPGSYTSSRLPVKLVYFETFMDPQQAIDWEKRLKGWSRRKKEALIEGRYSDLKELSKCRNNTSHLRNNPESNSNI